MVSRSLADQSYQNNLPMAHFWLVLKKVSRSFYLSLRYLPLPIRTPLALAYLLARFADTIADSVELSYLQRQALLQQFKLCVSELNSSVHFDALYKILLDTESISIKQIWLPFLPMLWNFFLQQSVAIQKEIQWVLSHITAGQQIDLDHFDINKHHEVIFNNSIISSDDMELPHSQTIMRFSTDAELDHYIYCVAGCVGEFWTRLCVMLLPKFSRVHHKFLIAWGVNFGKALQLTNILRDLPEDILMGRLYLPVERMPYETRKDVLAHLAKQNLGDLCRWRSTALSYLVDAKAYIQSVDSYRVRMACVLPYCMANNMLRNLGDFDYIASKQRVKIPRKYVYWYMCNSLFCKWTLL